MKLHQKISLILFGLFLTIVILEIGLHIGGFAILSIQEYRNLQSIKQKGSFRIMCLGESTTQGTYPPYLEEILNQRNIGIKFSVIDEGISGTNTGVILSELEYNIDKYQPDMVITMMGINDEGRHMPYETISTSKMVSTLRSLKVYKLARLFWLHTVTKLKETGFYVQDINKQKNRPKEVIELNPNSDSAYRGLGELYQSQGKYAEAEQSFKKAIELNPNSDSTYVELGWLWCYKSEGKLAEAGQSFKKAIELNPNNDLAYRGLGKLYQSQGKYAEAGQSFKKAIELNPNDDSTYIELGWLYKDEGKLAEAEQSLKKAIELNPNSDSAYRGLGELYQSQGKYAEAEQSFKKAIKLNPNDERLYGSLATIYREINNNEFSGAYDKKADSLINQYYNSTAVNNYRMLKQILDTRKIKLVCVQYPVRSIRPLKNIFKEETEGSIIFVDNEGIFKNAIRKEGYKEYFRDMFGGDFGHCTQKGNRLLAENIANVILKEIFDK